MNLDNLHKLYTEQLKDLYSAEKQLTKALPKMAAFATNKKLKENFKKHLIETEDQIERLEAIFSKMDISGGGKTCAAMKGLIEEGSELMKEDGDPAVLDAGLVAASQKVEHYEIASYGCVKAYAELLGDKNAVALLGRSLNEESKANEKLNDLAGASINNDASKAGAEARAKGLASAKKLKSRRNNSADKNNSGQRSVASR